MIRHSRGQEVQTFCTNEISCYGLNTNISQLLRIEIKKISLIHAPYTGSNDGNIQNQ